MEAIEGEPPVNHIRIDHAAAADMMRANPGVWHKLRSGTPEQASSLMGAWKGWKRPKAFADPRFQFAARSDGWGTRTSTVYGRYKAPSIIPLAEPPIDETA